MKQAHFEKIAIAGAIMKISQIISSNPITWTDILKISSLLLLALPGLVINTMTNIWLSRFKITNKTVVIAAKTAEAAFLFLI